MGIRLARFGYEVSTIDSETLEEAPVAWRSWLGQRTRWIKGWIQTYLVHMRRPWRLWRDLGSWRFFGFQVIILAMLVSMLVHPWFYVLVALHGAVGTTVIPTHSLMLLLCGSNLAGGYGAAALLIAATSRRSGDKAWSFILLPLYWLAISLAANRAVFEFIVKPFHWEKTQHGHSLGRRQALRG